MDEQQILKSVYRVLDMYLHLPDIYLGSENPIDVINHILRLAGVWDDPAIEYGFGVYLVEHALEQKILETGKPEGFEPYRAIDRLHDDIMQPKQKPVPVHPDVQTLHDYHDSIRSSASYEFTELTRDLAH